MPIEGNGRSVRGKVRTEGRSATRKRRGHQARIGDNERDSVASPHETARRLRNEGLRRFSMRSVSVTLYGGGGGAARLFWERTPLKV